MIFKFRTSLSLFSFIFIIIWVNSVWDDSGRTVIKKSGNEVIYEIPEIAVMNSQQRIYNEDLYGSDVELVIVVQVHNRPHYLQELINSLQKAPRINTTLLIFSHDLINKTINTIIQNITFTKFMQIFFPYSLRVHSRTFSGADETPSSSNFTRDSSLVQLKHHWWWKANFVFEKIKTLAGYSGLVLFLEEDHYVAPDFIHCLKIMKKFSHYLCPNCWFYSLGIRNHVNFVLFSDKVIIREKFESTGLAFNRTIWERIFTFREFFCRYDDYNWDWSLRHLYREISQEKSTMVMRAARVLHIGSCGFHSKAESCSAIEAIEGFENAQVNLFPDSLSIAFGVNIPELRIQKNGGWRDPRDQELCLRM